jgi:YHS domain-containing protein
VHHGPVVERNDDIFGATVNVAARLTAHANVGQLLTSDTIASLLTELGHLTTVALGPTLLRNVAEPVEVYWVADHSRGAASQVLDPVCRMFVDADAAPARLPWGERIWHFCSFDCAKSFVDDPTRHAGEPAS